MVPLDKIVGSVGRYRDFDRAFLPRKRIVSERWQRIAALYLNPYSEGIPPIEVYKVGGSYFVKDGNHRVSVARQLKFKEIEAYVWEYVNPVPGVRSSVDLDTLITESERQDFLAQTRLDDLRPNHNIRLTLPGGYTKLLRQIAHCQDVLQKIDGEPISYEDAVTGWYDLTYETAILLIKKACVLDLFPNRTEADFYVWITQHQRELRRRYGRQVMLQDATEDFEKRRLRSPVRRGWRWLRQRLGFNPARDEP
jgi:hypothetical protein